VTPPSGHRQKGAVTVFTGFGAFPLRPVTATGVIHKAYVGLASRLPAVGVDPIGALASTGNSPYLNREEWARTEPVAVGATGSTPVVIGIGALRTSDVLASTEDAQTPVPAPYCSRR
jgi:4-hydroxy-tetrahydrodipicolinate synthase